MTDQSSQLSSFLKTFGGRRQVPIPEPKPAAPPKPAELSNPVLHFDEEGVDPGIFGDSEQANGAEMQLAHMGSLIQMKTQQIERLQAEIRTLMQIQNSQAVALEMALQDRRELERQMAQFQTGLSLNTAVAADEPQRAAPTAVAVARSGSTYMQSQERPYFLENSMFLRAFLRNDQSALDELIKSIQAVTDQNTRGLAGQALFVQMQKYMQLNSFCERLSDESGTDNFVTTFESNVRNLLDSRRILLWARIPSAKVIVSRTASVLVPEGEGLLGKVVNDRQRLVLTDPSRDPSYSMDYDAPLLSNTRVSVYQPVINSKKEVLWVIQIIDRLNAKGSVVTPTGDDFLVLDFLALKLLKLYQEESRIDEMIKRILTESTRSLLIERQVMPLLETVQLTVTRIVGCESLQILFADPETKNLFQLTEAGPEAGPTSGVNLGQVRRVEIAVADAGIAGAAYTSKRSINVAVAKEHPGFNREIDGEFSNGAVIAVPLLSSKGQVSLVAIARQKRNSVMFTDSDEIILEALSRVSQGALANAQSHERNIQEIQKALNNHKYYTALLAVAQELSAVLDTDTLVRKIMAKAQNFIGADRCSLFLVDKVRGGIWSMVAHGTNDRIYVPIGGGIAGTVVATGETLNIPDAYNDPRFNSAVDKSTGYRTRSILCVAIHSGRGDIIGCTQMINKLGAPQFSATDVELMTAFNVFCGIALSNAQLFETATQSKKKMTAMLDIALSLSSSTTLDAIVTNIMGRAQELIEAEFCWLFVNDRARHVARPLAAKNEAATEFSLKQDAVGYVAVTGSELNLTNPKDDPRFDCFFADLMKIEVKSMLVIPVIDANGQIIGAVKAVNKKLAPRFTIEDQSLFRAFASFAGLALGQWVTKRPGDFGPGEIDFFETLSPSELTSCELSDRMRIFDPMLTVINSQKFDVYTCTKNDEFRILVHFFEKYDLLQHFHITLGVLLHFLEAAYNEYDHIPFHNWNCAVSSTQLLFWELMTSSEVVQWEKVELLALLVAGICHDCGRHSRGSVANEKAAFPLSLLYADLPVLETFHCASAVKLMSDPKCNILASMERDDVAEFWSVLIECILATDRAQHKKLLNEADVELRAGSGGYDTVSRSGKLLLMKLLVKSATVAPVARALDLNGPWSIFLIEEAVPRVSTSGEGLGAATKEIDAKGIAAAQVQFLDDFCIPLFDAVARMVQPLQVVSERIRANLAVWKGFLEG